MSAVNLCVKNLVCPILISPLPENWQYVHTVCANDWLPHNGFCYRILSEAEAGSWEESSQACGSQGANLTSLHSLSEVEMLLSLLANCKAHKNVKFCLFLERYSKWILHTVLSVFHSFWGEFRHVDRSLETSIVADCRVVWWLTSNSDTVAPVSASTQPDRCNTLRQGRQEGGKSCVCASFKWKHPWSLILTSQRIFSDQYWISVLKKIQF